MREWNRTGLVELWRERWADHVNARLAELDIDARIDHRSLEAQGIDLEPQDKIGPAASRRLERGEPSERAEDHRAAAARNGERIIVDPSIALDAITHYQATFTRRDLAMFVHRHTDGNEQYERAMSAVRASPDLVPLGKDGRQEERFTSRDMLDTEKRLEATADRLAARSHEGASRDIVIEQAERAGASGLTLGVEQQAALEHIMKGRGLSMVVGYAGTGKSAMLGVAHDAWAAQGRVVWGMALSGIAAEKLEEGSHIPSRTIVSMELAWSRGRDLPGPGDILVVDEAGMVGTRQMARVLAVAEQNQAQVVLVGDAEQLQAIEAGAVFRSLVERHGAMEISDVRRQQEGWQRQATRWLATGRTAEVRERHAELMHRLADAPDYAPSLAVIQKTLDWIVEQYANPLTADDVLKRVAETTARMDRPNRAALKAARADMIEISNAMNASREAHLLGAERARTIRMQTRQCRQWLVSGLVAGGMLMMVAPGMLARAAPSRWLLPERLAARALRLPMADAGRHLLVAANPLFAYEIVEGARLMVKNRDKIAKCRNARPKADVVTCKITVSM
ncbi:DUF6118 family protein [Sphingobium sp. Ndbn-10]|uniref:DUF6118 family protein n=1 Tax=Sphingobium sp. Ndbn-10 TaxID=1667223 RepID=UPI00201DDE29|nr:DUF6118 family protein [Sphingobium sp. Ndbn-10]